MKKNVLVVTGSPRQGGNTEQMAEAFARGARAAGHDVTLFNAATDPIQPCRGCDACWSNGKACVFDNEGYARLAPLMEKADAIALCSPVYWFSFSGQLKMVIDKVYPFSGASERKLKATMYLLMCAGDPSPEIFTAAKHEFDNSFSHLGLPIGGYVLAPGVYLKDDIKNTDFLNQAEKLGREIA